MNFEFSDKVKELRAKLTAFMAALQTTLQARI